MPNPNINLDRVIERMEEQKIQSGVEKELSYEDYQSTIENFVDEYNYREELTKPCIYPISPCCGEVIIDNCCSNCGKSIPKYFLKNTPRKKKS